MYFRSAICAWRLFLCAVCRLDFSDLFLCLRLSATRHERSDHVVTEH